MKTPSTLFPFNPGSVAPKTPKLFPDPLLDPQAFDFLIKNRGVQFTHYRATFCPNVVDLDTNAHDPNCTACENGMIMYNPKTIIGVFGNGTLERIYQAQGVWELGNAVCTFPAKYDDGSEADFQAFDKLICDTYEHRTTELVQYNQRDGFDSTRYPIISIDVVQTTDQVFTEGVDFAVQNNGIVWLAGGKTPKWYPDLDKGEVYTVAYTANPVYFVVQLMHELRATQAQDPNSSSKISIRLPQQVLIRRDFLMGKLNKDRSEGRDRADVGTQIITS